MKPPRSNTTEHRGSSGYGTRLQWAGVKRAKEKHPGHSQGGNFRKSGDPPHQPVVLDLKDEGEQSATHTVKLEGVQLDAYKYRAEKLLKTLLEKSDVLKKIRAGRPVTAADTQALADQVMQLDPEFSLEGMLNLFADAQRLELAIRRILGMDAAQVDAFFLSFSQAHPRLTSTQIRFLDLLKNHIARYGLIEVEKLWQAPFTSLSSDGLSGVFPDAAQDEILAIVKQINLETTP